MSDTTPTIEERTIDLLLQLSNAYFDLLAQTSQQKRVIAAQGNLIGQCMERIMTLEGRSILGDFNQRIEQLESWLYTHDYAYFQEQENKTGNSSFEEYEMHHPDPSYVEGDPFADPSYVERKLDGQISESNLEETGTCPHDCYCPFCEPQERSMTE